MKRIFSILLLALTVWVAQAQTALKIDTSSISYENKLRPCLEASVDPPRKDLKKAWDNYLNKNYKVDLKGVGKDKDMYGAKDVMVAAISDKRMNFYTSIAETANGSDIKVFASFGYDIYISSDSFPKEFAALQNITHSFLKDYLNKYYSDAIKTSTKLVSKMGKEKTKLVKSISKNTKKIEKLSKEINTANAAQKNTQEDMAKSLDQVNKLSKEKSDLENQNTQSNIDIQTLDKKLVVEKQKLVELKAKHESLMAE